MKALRYAKRLVSFDSTSHLTNRLISKYLEQKLVKHGFVVETLQYEDRRGTPKVNLIAKKGNGVGGLAYFGHSDVVPAKNWFTNKFGPFQPTIANERLYGRGACDMKGSVACMLAASQLFSRGNLKQPLYFVMTADEEVGFHGARNVVEESKFYREMAENGTKALIGEPTMLEVVYAHKGSLEFKAKSKGVAAHSSTNEGVNSTLPMIPFLAEAKKIYDEIESQSEWQSDLFNPSTVGWNIMVRDDAPAMNITPSKTICKVYARPLPDKDMMPLIQRLEKVAAENGIKLSVNYWCEPFQTDPKSEFVKETLRLAQRQKAKTVSFATDGGLFSQISDKIVFGPGSISQAHTNNEWISLDQLSQGTQMYSQMIQRWCVDCEA
jgi:acetylornithine deacetylase